MKINVGISNRHVHLTKEVYDKLFSKEISKRNDLSQKGEFASNEVVTLENDGKKIENVRIVGPLRSYNQVEILRSDCKVLGINPPTRRSGDLKESTDITISTKLGKINLKSVLICQEFHIHMDNEFAKKHHIKDKDILKVLVNTDKKALIYAHAKVTENGVLEFQIDRDDANSLNLHYGDKVELLLEDENV